MRGGVNVQWRITMSDHKGKKKRRGNTKTMPPQEMKEFGEEMRALVEKTGAMEIKYLRKKGVIQ